ncbi:MAG TPA: carboxymuconolactone decarboxylase family protein [Polyangiaceae bacterium]|nr:carboxymuconolactone decarboxylase family protein [Polyangiaceae bacterium]
MSWLTVPDDTATPELERLTEPWRSRGERVPPVVGVLKRNPRAFSAVLGLNYAVAFGASSLGRRREELIATWVSALNDCFFCLATHARYLEGAWTGSPADYAALVSELTELAPRLRAEVHDEQALQQLRSLPGLENGEAELLSFVAELSRVPEETCSANYQRLRAAGHSEAEVLDAVLIASCFAFMNRLACGTGVTLDESKHAGALRLFGQAALDRHLSWGDRSGQRK